MEITSLSNSLVKEVAKLQQKKYRNESGKFLIEGFKAIKEAFDFGIQIEKIFVNKDNLADYEFAKDLIIETNTAVLKKISTTESAPNAIAIGYQKKYSPDVLTDTQKVILLEGIKDGGNLGTIIRSAVAFGFDSIVLYGDCIDLYNPKCVRSAVGNLWKIPFFNVNNITLLEKYFKNHDRVATLPRAKNLLNDFVVTKPCVLLFGSEADGLSEELINFSTNSVKIEMQKSVESLNLAISASIIMYKLAV